MSDNPHLTGTDRRFVSTQQHEVDSFIDSLQGEFLDHPRPAILAALEACRREIAPSESRERLKECVRERLGR